MYSRAHRWPTYLGANHQSHDNSVPHVVDWARQSYNTAEHIHTVHTSLKVRTVFNTPPACTYGTTERAAEQELSGNVRTSSRSPCAQTQSKWGTSSKSGHSESTAHREVERGGCSTQGSGEGRVQHTGRWRGEGAAHREVERGGCSTQGGGEGRVQHTGRWRGEGAAHREVERGGCAHREVERGGCIQEGDIGDTPLQPHRNTVRCCILVLMAHGLHPNIIRFSCIWNAFGHICSSSVLIDVATSQPIMTSPPAHTKQTLRCAYTAQ